MEKNMETIVKIEKRKQAYAHSKINIEQVKNRHFYFFFKRCLDIVGSTVGLIILSPLFLGVILAMKIEEPKGPIFFSQLRVGKNQKVFRIYKFRSMCVNAEDKLSELLNHNEIAGAMFKMKDDPRVTTVGKFIRKTSIDELPQLWNVLRGEMSLVGPRPPLEREVSFYSVYDMQRLFIKPGCTGVWQVSGRSNVDFDEMVAMDIDYIQNLTTFNDIKIIIKTFYVMLRPNSAY